MKQVISPLFAIGIWTVGCIYTTGNTVLAQVTADGTVNTQVTQNGNVAEITGGETRGSNLFHSFQDFSVQTGNEAFFNNADRISNIFSRVTGGNISNIDGAIRANGSASLFLINPAGIIFGENARLDIGGSFYGSSASSILFEEGEFSAVDNIEQPILTINAPVGLGFRDNPGDITVQNSNLTVSSEQNISLLGNDINISDAYIEALGGTVNLGAVSSEATINLGENLDIDFGSVTPGNIQLSNAAIVNVSGMGGGGIEVNAGNLTLSEESIFNAGINPNSSDIESQAGNITIDVTENVVLESASIIRNNVNLNGSGNGGDIQVNAQNLSLADNSRLSSITQGNGNSGNIKLVVSNLINLENSNIQTSTLRNGVGNAGSIEITTTDLSLFGESKEVRSNLLADSSGIGDAGNIIIEATGNISLVSNSSINNKALEGSGNAGDISINSDILSVDGRSFILNDNGDPEIPVVTNIGNSGDIFINSRIVTLDNISLISNSSFANAIGEAGNITVNADSLRVAGGSNISTLTENNTNGGEININAQNIELFTGGTIATATGSDGNAGNITLNVIDEITIDGDNPIIPSEDLRFTVGSLQELEPFTGLFANTLSSSTGNGGNIEISNPRIISLSNSAEITVDSQGFGNGGNLLIETGSLSLESQSRLFAETVFGQTEQQPSNIILRVNDTLSLRGDSQISASALNNANGGNVTIDANFIIAFPPKVEGNDIIANAREGSGGNISIATEGIFGIQERSQNPRSNDIDASSQVDGLDGVVTIKTPDVNPLQGATDLTSNIIAPRQNIVQTCKTQLKEESENSFTIKGKGGTPPAPDLPLDSHNISVNGQANTKLVIPAPIETAQGKIQLARGIKVTESGEVILTAYQTNNAGDRIPSRSVNCGRV